jgi:hypothetical protein
MQGSSKEGGNTRKMLADRHKVHGWQQTIPKDILKHLFIKP